MPPAALRLPSTLQPSTSPPPPSIPPPTLQWLTGPWNVTHSTLPMWRKSRNVRITYTPIAGTMASDSAAPHIDDVVTYQSLSSEAIKSIHGVDKPFDVSAGDDAAAAAAAAAVAGEGGKASLGYNWRGKGWLMIASSKWEILGHGDEGGAGNSWVVTYFAKTLFTPAGVDFYSRKGALKPETLESIKAGLEGLGGDVGKLANELFEVKMDDARTE